MLGRELRKIREDLMLTQIKMADELGISRALLQKYESGSQKISKRTEIAAVAVAERIFLANAPVDYKELVEELKRRIRNNELGTIRIGPLFDALGAEQFRCNNCRSTYMSYDNSGARDDLHCDACRLAKEAASSEAA